MRLVGQSLFGVDAVGKGRCRVDTVAGLRAARHRQRRRTESFDRVDQNLNQHAQLLVKENKF